MEMLNINNIEITRDMAGNIACMLRQYRKAVGPFELAYVDDVLTFLDDQLSRPELEEVDGIPTWALEYLEYGEDDSIEKNEIAMIKEFLEENHYRFSSVKDPDDYAFDRCPQFGDPCNTCTCIFEIVKDKENDGK